MKCSCVWIVVRVGAHNFHIECGSLGGGLPCIYVYIYIHKDGERGDRCKALNLCAKSPELAYFFRHLTGVY